MFSFGQIIFATIFIVLFSLIIVISYKKDSKNHKVYYKGTYKIFLFFILGIIALFLIKYFNQSN